MEWQVCVFGKGGKQEKASVSPWDRGNSEEGNVGEQ